MSLRNSFARTLCIACALVLPQAHAAGVQIPWADPIGTSPPLGTAPGTASVPYAEPIGSSRLNPRTVQQPLYPQRQPVRQCYRAVDVRGEIVTRCTLVR